MGLNAPMGFTDIDWSWALLVGCDGLPVGPMGADGSGGARASYLGNICASNPYIPQHYE